MKKIFLCLLAMIAAWTAQAQFSYYFFDENNVWRTIPSAETPAIKITDATTTLNQNDAWYLIEDDISLSECTVTGKNVHLFIPEYKCLTTSNFVVASGASLLVYCNGTYSQGSIKGPSATPLTAIIEGTLTLVNGRLGRYDGSTSLKITETGIVNVNNDGKIYTESIGDGAGIEIEGELNVNGSVYASGRDDKGTGIDVASKGKLTLFPGSYVEAKGSTNGASIDAKGTVNITGGRVYATENNGIGIGSASTVGTISITGGQVYTSLIGHNSSGNGGTIILGWTDRSNEINATGFEADHISIANDQLFIVDNVWLEGELSTEQITKLSNADILNPPTVPVPDNIPQFEKLKEVYNIDYDGKFHSVLELLGNPVVENPYGKIVYIVGGKETEDPKVQSPGEYTISYRFKSTDPRILDEDEEYSHPITTVSVNAIELCDDSYRYAIIDKEKKTVCVLGFNYSAENFTYAGGLSEINIPSTVTLSSPTVDGKTEPSTYSITQIGRGAFDNETGIQTVNLHDGLQSIGERAFERCGITNITFPSTLREIGDSAFHRQLIGEGKINVKCQGILAPIFVSGSCTVHNHPFPFAQCSTLEVPENSFGYQSWFGFNGFIDYYDHFKEEDPSYHPETSMYNCYSIEKYEFDNTSIPDLIFTKEYDGSATSSTVDGNGMICGFPAKINDEYSITQITLGKSFDTEGILEESNDSGSYSNAIVVVKSSITGEEITYQFRDKINATIKPLELDLETILKNEIFDQKEYDGNTDVKYKNPDNTLTYGEANNLGTTISYILPTGDKMELVFKTNEKPTYDKPDAGDRKIIIPAKTHIAISINIDKQNFSKEKNYIITGIDENYNLTISSEVDSKIKRRNINEWLNTEPYSKISVEKSKNYDGTANAQGITPQPDHTRVWTRSEEDYDYQFTVTYSAVYVNANGQPVSEPGERYSVKITFTIENDNNFCFINEKGEEVSSTDRIIQQGECSIIGDKIKLKDGIHQSDNFSTYCAEGKGRVVLSFTTVDANDKINYCIIAVDLEPSLNQTAKVVDNSTTELNIPSNIKPGKYKGKLVFTADEEGKIAVSDTFDFEINIAVPRDVIKTLYTDVIFVDNKYGHYSKYQWCKGEGNEATPIKGSKYSNRQYYTEEDRLLDDIYSVILTTTDGIELRSCPFKPDTHTTKLSPTVTPYPNPAKAGVPFTLKLIGGVPENASIMIFNNAGAQVLRIDNVNEYTTITLPRGFYSGALIYDGQKSGFKIIVE